MTITGGRLIRAMLDDEDGHSESTNALHFCVEGDLRMNERIKQLAEQCESFGSWDNKTYSFDKEKFAELIVRECYEHCRGQILDKEVADTNELTYNDAVGDCANGLLQHFGVEE